MQPGLGSTMKTWAACGTIASLRLLRRLRGGSKLTSSSGLMAATAGDDMGHAAAAAGAGKTRVGGAGLTAAGGTPVVAEEGQGKITEARWESMSNPEARAMAPRMMVQK